MGKSFAQNLIEHGSQILDRQLEDLFPNIFLLTSEGTKTRQYQFSNNELDMYLESQCQHQTDHSEQISDYQESISTCLSKRKKISKKLKKEDNYYSDSAKASLNPIQHIASAFKRPRKAKAKKVQYPTKNFLPNFKVPHLNFIKKYYPNCMNDYPAIALIQKKDGISLKDYEYLYRIPKLRPIFKIMFEQRILYRQLLLSRSDVITKLIHQKKLHVFEEAYNSQIFQRIN